MKISSEFQKFFFGVVCKQLKEEATKLRKPLKYQHPMTGDWYWIDIRNVKEDMIYQLLKLINPLYPKVNMLLPMSTKDLSSKQLTEHIKWVERFASENGLELGYIAQEWEEILKQANIIKE